MAALGSVSDVGSEACSSTDNTIRPCIGYNRMLAGFASNTNCACAPKKLKQCIVDSIGLLVAGYPSQV